MSAQSERKVLVVDDEPDIRELIEITLGRMSINTAPASCVSEAKQRLKASAFNLVLTDMKLPDGTGIELVEHIQQHYSDTPVAVITAFGSMDTAIDALKAGAFDFVSKPVDLTDLRKLIDSALELRNTAGTASKEKAPFSILGESPAIKNLQSRIKKLARSQAPVYINGESGSGKELVARMIHALGPRNEAPFIPVNCGAIPGELMESEFFGHKKGSFTGAVSDKTGLFQAADSGTLFLDEVADLPLHMQVKLLRAIQEKSIRPIGDQKERSVDIRILSATHKDLQQLVEAGHFRQDLFYRINVIQLDVPPLRAREGDIHLLAHHVLKRLATEWGIEDPILAPSAQDALARYSFPGNVRELENILERALTLSDQQTILEEHLQLPTQTQVNLPTETAPKEAALNNPNNSNLNKTATEHSESASALTSTSIVLEEELENINDLEAYLARIEKQVILLTLKTTRWNRTAAAKKLGMTFRSLRYRLKKLDIDEHSDTSDT